jgi:hypothetical protein
MKKLYTLSFTLLAAVASFGQTTDQFTGTGTLAANGWSHHSPGDPTPNIGQIVILTTPSDSGNSLSYAGLAPSTGNRTAIVAGNVEDVNKALTAPITTGTVYYSALIKAVDNTSFFGNAAGSDYFMALSSATGTSVTLFFGRLYVRQGVTDGTFNLGVANGTPNPVVPNFAAQDLTVGTTYLVVVKYDIATSTASLFINPVIGGAEPASLVSHTSTALATQIASVAIREGGSAATGTGNIEIDEVRVDATWAGVTPVNLATQDFAIAGLKVYPNPVKGGNLYITSDSNETKAVAIYNVLGKQVLTASVNDAPINVSNLSAGVYIVKITEAGKTASKKLVIE